MPAFFNFLYDLLWLHFSERFFQCAITPVRLVNFNAVSLRRLAELGSYLGFFYFFRHHLFELGKNLLKGIFGNIFKVFFVNHHRGRTATSRKAFHSKKREPSVRGGFAHLYAK